MTHEFAHLPPRTQIPHAHRRTIRSTPRGEHAAIGRERDACPRVAVPLELPAHAAAGDFNQPDRLPAARDRQRRAIGRERDRIVARGGDRQLRLFAPGVGVDERHILLVRIAAADRQMTPIAREGERQFGPLPGIGADGEALVAAAGVNHAHQCVPAGRRGERAIGGDRDAVGAGRIVKQFQRSQLRGRQVRAALEIADAQVGVLGTNDQATAVTGGREMHVAPATRIPAADAQPPQRRSACRVPDAHRAVLAGGDDGLVRIAKHGGGQLLGVAHRVKRFQTPGIPQADRELGPGGREDLAIR